MLRSSACVLVLLACGCLMPNPAYLGETEGGTRGLDGSGSAGGTSAADGGTDGDATVGHEGGTTTNANVGGSSAGDSSAGEGGTTTSPDGTTGRDAVPLCPRVDGLRLCVPFDAELPSQVIDDSPNAYDINIGGGELVPSPWDSGFHFDASTWAYVDCDGECRGGPTITYDAWVRVESEPYDRSGVIDNHRVLGLFITSELDVQCVSQNGTVVGGALTLDTWVHVACVADEEALTAYLDGDPVAQMSIAPLAAVELSMPLALGNDMPTFSDPLFGDLDRVRMWDVALTPAQIQLAATP